MVDFLERMIAAAPGKPEPTTQPEHPMRAVTRQIAFEAGGWTPARSAKVVALFDGLAPEWHRHADDTQRTAPLSDAYARGGVDPGGRCLEVGSGTGANTEFLAERHDLVIAGDLSQEMLTRVPHHAGARVRADAGATPLRTGTVDVAVLVNAFLFPSEMDRVIAPEGVLVWVNTAGDITPIYLPAEDVEAVLPGRWLGVAAEAGWGTWAVFHRAP